MLFNSFSFLVFFPIVFILYWILNKNVRYQNILLLIASYYFYSCWDWHFLFLLIFSTLLDFYSGKLIYQYKSNVVKQKWILILSIGINLGLLLVFKYNDFFINSFCDLLQSFGFKTNRYLLNVILPVGISFYTFHGLSYVIDVKKDKITPEYSFINYSLFVSFFPLLVAGPIERATHLLPQIKRSRIPDYSKMVDGLRQVLWGLFKKIVVADQISGYVNQIYDSPGQYSGAILLMGTILFTIQIYGDFSGYSDIALGTARMMGFELLQNFSYPYFSRNLGEFWRRWHISLSSWFRDYVYFPLGGNRVGMGRKIFNVFVIFLVSGFWHGANWTYVFWGGVNAFFVLPSVLFKSKNKYEDIVAINSRFPSLIELIQVISTFILVCLIFIIFRSPTISFGYDYFYSLFSDLFNKSSIIQAYNFIYWNLGFQIPIYIFICFAVEWIGRRTKSPLSLLNNRKPIFNQLIYIFLVLLVLYYSGKENEFIYFQF